MGIEGGMLGFLVKLGWRLYSTVSGTINEFPQSVGAIGQALGHARLLFGGPIRWNFAPSSLAKHGNRSGSADRQHCWPGFPLESHWAKQFPRVSGQASWEVYSAVGSPVN